MIGWRTTVQCSALAAVYFGSAAVTLHFTRLGAGLAVVWLSGAILLAKLLTAPRRQWPFLSAACALAGLAASALFGIGGWASSALALISIAEAFVAAWLLKRLCPRVRRFDTPGEVIRFLAIAGLLVPGAGAFVGAWCAELGRGIPYWFAWRGWFAGHALGFVTATPALAQLSRNQTREWLADLQRQTKAETIYLLVAVIVCLLLTFLQNEIPLVALPFVPMIFATFRLGRLGAVFSIVFLVTIGLTCTLLGMGPAMLVRGGVALKIEVLQIYLATAVLVLLPIAAELQTRRHLLDRLRRADTLHRLILERSGDVVVRAGPDGRLRYASPFVEQAWGYLPAELIGCPSLEFVLAEDAPRVVEARRRAAEAPDTTILVEYRLRRKDGTYSWVESHMRATLDEADQPDGTVSIIRDIAERKRAVEVLARQATTDPLTGLANRRLFDDALLSEIRDNAVQDRGCVALLDLDFFKRINDRYGHAKGDEVLVDFANVLRGCVREEDVVARIGGEEFALLLRGVSIEKARSICERIRFRLASRNVEVDAIPALPITTSVGIATLKTGSSSGEAVRAADDALYSAKGAGRNCVVVANGAIT